MVLHFKLIHFRLIHFGLIHFGLIDILFNVRMLIELIPIS